MAFLKKLSSIRKRRSLLPGKAEPAADASTSNSSAKLPSVAETSSKPTTTAPAAHTAVTGPNAASHGTQQQPQEPAAKSTQVSGTSAEAHSNTANALYYQRLAFTQVGSTPPQLDAALTNINASIQLNPDDGMSWKLKGIVFQAAENYKQAYMAYTEAVARLEGQEKQTVQSTLYLIAMLKQAQQTETAKRMQNAPSTPSNARAPAPSLSAPSSPQAPTQTAQTSQISQITPHPTEAAQTEPSQVLPVPKPILLMPPSSSSATHPLLAEFGALKHPEGRDLLITLIRKCAGALYLVGFNGIGSVEQVALFFMGQNYAASQRLDIPRLPPSLHPSWEKSFWRVNLSLENRRFNYDFETVSLPGNDVFDFDCETVSQCDGCHLGTASVRGYNETYRLQQGSLPKGHAKLEVFSSSQAWIQQLSVLELINRLDLSSKTYDLERIGAPGIVEAIISYATSGDGAACTTIQLAPPGYLSDIRTFFSFSSNIAKITPGNSLGLLKFLQHVLIGEMAGALVRNLAINPRFPNKVQVSPALCALIALGRLWREHLGLRRSGNADIWHIVPSHPQIHAEGLVRFAEGLGWPYVNEACDNINQTLKNFNTNMFGFNIHPYLLDWFFGLVLPGRYFRHRIMSCLILLCPETRELGICPSFDSGLVIFDKSYWPKLSVLGRILACLDQSKMTCGWVRPLPAPKIHGLSFAWARIEAQPAPLPPPLSQDGSTYLESCGYSDSYDRYNPTPFPADLANFSKWNPPRSLPPRPSSFMTQGRAELQALRLDEVESQDGEAVKTYRAKLDFSINGDEVSFTIRYNPLFVHVPNCNGTTHPMHDRHAQKLLKRVIHARQLNNGAVIPAGPGLIIIDAREPGEEAMARAWCAEVGKNAVVRKGGQGCFTCAVSLAASQTGLGFNTLIWCQ